MALNNFEYSHLMPLRFKGLSIAFVVGGSPRERWLNGNADDCAADCSDPVDDKVLVYWSTAAAERSHAGRQRI